MSPDHQVKGLASENRELGAAETATPQKPKNLYNRMEWAGAFGDVGTLIPKAGRCDVVITSGHTMKPVLESGL